MVERERPVPLLQREERSLVQMAEALRVTRTGCEPNWQAVALPLQAHRQPQLCVPVALREAGLPAAAGVAPWRGGGAGQTRWQSQSTRCLPVHPLLALLLPRAHPSQLVRERVQAQQPSSHWQREAGPSFGHSRCAAAASLRPQPEGEQSCHQGHQQPEWPEALLRHRRERTGHQRTLHRRGCLHPYLLWSQRA